MQEHDNIDIQALGVMNAILEVLARSGGRVSAAQLARDLGTTAPRMSRYLSSMQALGFVDTLPGERGYALGWKLIRLGQAAVDNVQLTEVAQAEAALLRDSIQDSVYVAVPHKQAASVVIFLRGRASVALHVPLGTRFSGHASASGRVVMAFAQAREREALLAAMLDPADYPDPITDRTALAARYETIREQFYDVAVSAVRSKGDLQRYVAGVAVPIFGLGNSIAGSIGILSGFVGIDDLRSNETLSRLQETALRISRSLGGDLWERRLDGAGRPAI